MFQASLCCSGMLVSRYFLGILTSFLKFSGCQTNTQTRGRREEYQLLATLGLGCCCNNIEAKHRVATLQRIVLCQGCGIGKRSQIGRWRNKGCLGPASAADAAVPRMRPSLW